MAKKTPAASYYELLQHPEWQKIRLKVMELAQFACEECDASDKQLSVHHSYYEKGMKPWEYPLESLHCLCGDCHRAAQDLKALLNRQLGRIGVSGDLEILYGYAKGMEAQEFPMTVIDVPSYEVAIGIGDRWGLDPTQVIDALHEGKIDGWKLGELYKAKNAAKGGPK